MAHTTGSARPETPGGRLRRVAPSATLVCCVLAALAGLVTIGAGVLGVVQDQQSNTDVFNGLGTVLGVLFAIAGVLVAVPAMVAAGLVRARHRAGYVLAVIVGAGLVLLATQFVADGDWSYGVPTLVFGAVMSGAALLAWQSHR